MSFAALRENLDRSGKLRQLKAQLRADVYNALHNANEVERTRRYALQGFSCRAWAPTGRPTGAALTQADQKALPQVSNENLLINELIREYLVRWGPKGNAVREVARHCSTPFVSHPAQVYNAYRGTVSVFLPGESLVGQVVTVPNAGQEEV